MRARVLPSCPQSVLTLQDEVATLRHLVFPKCADVDTTSASVNGGTYVGSTAVTGGDYLHDGDIEVECEDGYYFNDQLTWNCTETGGVATLAGRVRDELASVSSNAQPLLFVACDTLNTLVVVVTPFVGLAGLTQYPAFSPGPVPHSSLLVRSRPFSSLPPSLAGSH